MTGLAFRRVEPSNGAAASLPASGDALEGLVRAHWRELHGMLTAITGNASTAEDLAQEVFLLAFRKGLRSGPGARSWFRKTARYLALNERRRPLPLAPEDIERMCDAPAPADAAADAVDFNASLVALRECMAELKDADRQLLAARYECRDPLETVAAAVGQTVGYLKQRLFRLRQRLRACVSARLGCAQGTEPWTREPQVASRRCWTATWRRSNATG